MLSLYTTDIRAFFAVSARIRRIRREDEANKPYMHVHEVIMCTRPGAGSMAGKRKKTVLRTIRLSEEIDGLLESDAEKQNISTNALVGKILTRYVEWDRIVERLHIVSFSNAFFVALLNEVSDDTIRELAAQEAVQQIKNHALWDFGKTDYDTLLKTILLIGKYGIATEVSVESWGDGNYVITLRHTWGPKGAVFFRSFFDSFIRTVAEVQPRIDIADDVMAVSFHKPPGGTARIRG